MNIVFLGASPGTSNMGVSALFATMVAGVSRRLPEARIHVFDVETGHRSSELRLDSGDPIPVEFHGIRHGRRYYRPENIVQIRLCSRLGGLGRMLSRQLRVIQEADCILDISGETASPTSIRTNVWILSQEEKSWHSTLGSHSFSCLRLTAPSMRIETGPLRSCLELGPVGPGTRGAMKYSRDFWATGLSRQGILLEWTWLSVFMPGGQKSCLAFFWIMNPGSLLDQSWESTSVD